MRALRNCPTVWRVAIYGPITHEFHKYITILTTHDTGHDEMGEEFLPMRCCILDKAPVDKVDKDAKTFDIVILFERKSLIEPKLDLIGNGPTVNLKTMYSISEEAKRNILKVEKGFGGGDVKSYRPFIPKVLRPAKKFGKFDSPLLPKDENSPKLELVKRIRTPPPDLIDDDDDSQPYVPLPVKIKMKEKGILEPPLKNKNTCGRNFDIDRTIKKRSKRFDCPSPPKKELSPSEIENGWDSPPRKTSQTSSLSPKRKNRRNSPSPPRRTFRRDSLSPSTRISRKDSISPHRRSNHTSDVSFIKKENFSANFSSIENQKYSKRPLSERESISVSVKKEKDNSQSFYPVKVEKDYSSKNVSGSRPKRIDTEKEEGEISNESNDSSTFNSPERVSIKNESMECTENHENATSNIDNSVVVKTERESPHHFSMFQNIKIKEEPKDDITDVPEETQPVKIKTEPVSNSPPNMTDFETMATPIHNPAALEQTSFSVSPTNFTINGQAITVQPNQSFLSAIKQEPQDPVIDEPIIEQKPFVKIKLEKNYSEQQNNLGISDTDEVCIIQEKKNAVRKERAKRFDDDGEEDLRKLLEKQRALQRQLAQSEFAVKRERSSSSEELTHSSSSEVRYRQTPPRNFSPRTRIVSTKLLRNKITWSRSPSPKYRSRSPYCSRYRDRSSHSYRYRGRSPTTSAYSSRSPLSPGRKRVRRSRSPVSFRRRSRSPGSSRHKSPYSPRRRSRSPFSPGQRSRSPYSARDVSRLRLPYKHRAWSPARHGSSHSRDSSKLSRNNWSPNRSKWNQISRSKSRSLSQSLSPKRIKREISPTASNVSYRESLSLSLSPTPPPMNRKFTNHENKREKKRDHHKKDKKKPKSKSPENKKLDTSLENELPKSDSASSSTRGDWDIPRLSHLKAESSEKTEDVKSTTSHSANPSGNDEKESS